MNKGGTHLTGHESWRPIGVDELEPGASEVVRSRENMVVVAGPGAGKTELLAQRACYLLQTGIVPFPKRILAISFKRDAAKNLKDRVSQRCSSSEAARFDSFTFDAFSKGLLDRFHLALVENWRPSSDYEILLPNFKTFPNFLDGLGAPPTEVATESELQAVPRLTFEKRKILGSPLPEQGITVEDASTWAAEKWWKDSLVGALRSRLTFPMIGRLVELLIRTNPKICQALRNTYSHVFLDEFQDTTHVQYDLVKTVFLGSDTVLTAVGDNKQQIMRWAMALEDPFTMFQHDFKAKRKPLVSNYRSSPELVRIQHEIALAVDENSEKAEPKGPPDISKESCVILEFSTPQQEAEYLAKFIGSAISQDTLATRDFAILVKQKSSEYASELAPTFQELDVKIRDESNIQDLLAERLVSIIISFLRLGSQKRAGKNWVECNQILFGLKGHDSDNIGGGIRLREGLWRFHSTLNHNMEELPTSKEQVLALVDSILQVLNEDTLKLSYPEYSQGDWYASVVDRLVTNLFQSCQTSETWPLALDDLEGTNSLPLMTIHKSKGLEYHTVVFLALDDQAWWSFKNQPEEGKATFFVAFSRAKQRVVFTYCEGRGDRRNISSLYDILQSAGVPSRFVA